MSKFYSSDRIKVPRFEESAGFYTTEQRSGMMSKIRAENTKPEQMFRKALWACGVRYRLNSKSIPGKPDISNQKLKFVVFIDGEFWHGYNWEEKKHKIKSNRGFWIPKIERNMQRDREINRLLTAGGLKVFRFWESEVKKELGRCVNEVLQFIHPTFPYNDH
ncbi:MAG: very short patch repair endonuclease [Cytophagales bacterium CG12_big_fil_rev_8_21_14_0_65_40_12]|nr:MAG: very short patch repair endonuclease [Cytophagales bacterium CG12_big_fil_rev_8_21_14_0_65_40_12]PIW05078.1 MAG: very short patch repair endonuclease [Cytophagales bacterium CG17_big_fil_post_rev_8_21_14_2_50_40_13]